MLLEVKDLTVKYDQIAALKGISLQVEEGKLTTLLGSNGAGKSTLLKTVSGALKPAAGDILYMGSNIAKLTSHDIVKKGIVQCPEGRKVFPRQTVYENLKMGAFVRNDREIGEDIEKYYQQFPILKERRNQKAGLLSGGEQQMLAICRALMSRPKLLMLDVYKRQGESCGCSGSIRPLCAEYALQRRGIPGGRPESGPGSTVRPGQGEPAAGTSDPGKCGV